MTEPMIQISKSDIKAVESLLSDVKNGATKAMVTAINSTITTTRVQTKKRIGQKLNLKAARINQDLSVEKANYQSISGKVRAIGEPIGLINFAGKQLKSGVKVRVMKGDSQKLLKHAFRSKKSGTEHLFWREYDETRQPVQPGRKYGALPKAFRLPLWRLTGPRIEDIMAHSDVIGPLQTDAGKLLAENLDKKVQDILRRYHG